MAWVFVAEVLGSCGLFFVGVVDVELSANVAVSALADMGLEVAVESWPGVAEVFLGFVSVAKVMHVYAVELVDFVPAGFVVVLPVFEDVL